jgi:hypothetical protein
MSPRGISRPKNRLLLLEGRMQVGMIHLPSLRGGGNMIPFLLKKYSLVRRD